MNTLILLHTHWDREWYVSRETYLARLIEVLDDLVGALETGRLPAFSLDGQTSLLEDAATLAPDLLTRLKPALAEGRLQVGPWYTMPDTVLVSGEALIRNLERGIQAARELGCQEFCGYLPDSFGHSAGIPEVLAQVGLTTAMLWRGRNPHGQSSWFWWEGTGDRKLLTYQLPLGYFHTPLHPQEDQDTLAKEWTGLSEGLSAFATLPSLSHLHPLGGDHLAAPSAQAWEQFTTLVPDVEVLHPHQYLQKGLDVLAQSPTPLLTHLGELRESGLNSVGDGAPFLLSGTLSARLTLKQANARLERRLTHTTEPLLALAHRHGISVHPTPGAILDQAWRLMCLNQAHDSLCGCSTDAVHRENEARYQQVTDWCDALETRTLFSLGNQQGNGWLHIRSANVGRLADSPGRVVPVKARLRMGESLSLKAVQVTETTKVLSNETETDPRRVPLSHRQEQQLTGWAWLPTEATATDTAWPCVEQLPESHLNQPLPAEHAVTIDRAANEISNPYIKVCFEPDGTLTVTDRTTGQQFDQLNRGWMLIDKGDSYNRWPVPAVPPEPWELAHVKWLTEGPLCAEAQLSLRFPTRPHPVDWVKCHVRLIAGARRVEIDWTWTPPLPNRLIQTAFYQPQPVTEITVDDVLGQFARAHPVWPTRYHGFPVTSKTDEWLPNGGFTHGRLQTRHGGTILTDGLPDYEIVEGRWVCVTLHRGFGTISGGAMPSRGTPAGPPVPTPEGQGIGRHLTARYSWLPPSLEETTIKTEQAAFYRLERLMLDDKRPKTPAPSCPLTCDLPPLPHAPQVLSLNWDIPTGQSQPGWIVRLLNPTSAPCLWPLNPVKFARTLVINALGEPQSQDALEEAGLNLAPGALLTLYCCPSPVIP